MSDEIPQNAKDSERYAQILHEAKAIHGVSLGKDAWRRFRKNWIAMISFGFLILLAFLAFFTPLLPLQAPRLQNYDKPFAPPTISEPGSIRKIEMAVKRAMDELEKNANAEKKIDVAAKARKNSIETYFGKLNVLDRWMVKIRMSIFGTWAIPSLFGTDEIGRDVFARLFWGARISLIVGLVATLVSLIIGVSYGSISGYFGGKVDEIMMRFVDVLYSIPFIFVVIFLITILSEETIKNTLENDFGIDRITIFFFVVGAIYWLTMARVVRGQVISLKNEQFIEAARTIGASQKRIIFFHLVPNMLSVIIVYLTLTIPRVMLFEAFLSFLGLGVQAPNVSWGLMANQGFIVITPIKIFWWLVVFPGLALGLTLFALNFLGDGLRDALDPRMKNK